MKKTLTPSSCTLYPKDHCGVFGVFGHRDAARLTYLGLYALQHRGEESAGIVSSDGKNIHHHKNTGSVGDVFNEEIISKLQGHLAIGHTRYSTAGSSVLKNAQPLLVDYAKGPLAVGHNGNLVNAKQLRDALEQSGAIFQTTSDSEVIIHLIAHSKAKDIKDALVYAMQRIKGAYSLVMMTQDTLIGARDPYGFRPLCLGKLGKAYVLASETCALDLIKAEFVREIEPGEAIFITKKGARSVRPFNKFDITPKHCIFELVYFARPDSRIFGQSVHLFRQALGETLANEYPCDADIVIAIPDSGNSAALGFSHKSGIAFEFGMIRNHYIGRTFIQPSQEIRDFNVRIKLNPVKDILKGKKVIIVDDSIVRGTTSKARVNSIREAGAKEVHMRVSCPPIISPCFYGIDFPTKKELIAQTNTLDEIAKFLGVDSLGYISLEGMLSCAAKESTKYCTACFNADYPIKPQEKVGKFSLERIWQ